MVPLAVVLWSAGAAADTIYDVEHARASARAGGPISEEDAFLLERYGATSGTPDWRHRVRGSTFEYDVYVEPRRVRHKHRHRVDRD